MQKKAISKYSPEEIQRFVGQIPFFNDLRETDKIQFERIMQETQVQTFAPGEVILRKATQDKTFYSLIKGKVDVFPDFEPSKKAISQLSSGQIIGALGIINDEVRSATLAASKDEGATLIATDFTMMGELDDFSQLSLGTKISFYNSVVNNIRWKLEVYKKNTDDPTLAQELQLLTPFDGKKGLMPELEHLAEHAEMLGCLLDSWNDVVEADIVLPKLKLTNTDKKGVLASLFKRNKK
ncbi:MAG: cyclic nucleotide-binding domain-containing protein [Pseudomonadales bacterium]|nr:cyclic nucleotide-binding domain-containing protein [Pseudomonadales bacterium]